MTITTLPTPPSTSDPTNFATEADAFIAALPTFVTEANALLVAADADATSAAANAVLAQAAADAVEGAANAYGTSTTSNTITDTGDVTFTTQAGKTFLPGMYVRAARTSAPATTSMSGTVKTYSSTTLVVTMDAKVGSGSGIIDWTISSASKNGLPAASAAVIQAGTSTATSMTPGYAYDALAEVTLTDAATVTPDFGAGINFYLLTTSGIGSTRQLANPTSPKVGQSGHVRVVQDATGSRLLTYGSYWKRAGGATALTTTANATDIIVYEVITATYILYDIKKNAS